MSATKFDKSHPTIGFIGCGNMSSAIIYGLLDNGLDAKNILASNRSQEKLKPFQQQTKIAVTTDNLKVCQFAKIIVLGVKPQVLPSVCQQISSLDLSDKLIISIAAGITTESIENQLKQPIAVVRAMPNTPAKLSQSATGLYANQNTSERKKGWANEIFSAIGITEWVEKESLVDVVTAIAGSSPAYVFLLLQSMIEQAQAEGLGLESARNLATQAVLGAAKLAQNEPNESLQALRQAVTSPNGTTAAAIESFEKNNFVSIVKQAVSAAIERGKELATDNLGVANK